MEDGRRILRILLNILIPLTKILLIGILGPWLLKFFMPFVIGWILAMIANPLVRFLENHLKLVRKHSSAVIIILVLAGVVAGIYLLSSRLLAGCIELLKDLPQLFAMAKEDVTEAWGNVTRLFSRFPPSSGIT